MIYKKDLIILILTKEDVRHLELLLLVIMQEKFEQNLLKMN